MKDKVKEIYFEPDSPSKLLQTVRIKKTWVSVILHIVRLTASEPPAGGAARQRAGRYADGRNAPYADSHQAKPKTISPMTKDSTTIISTAAFKPKSMKTPRQSTLNFIRQFAGAYMTLPGIAVPTAVAN